MKLKFIAQLTVAAMLLTSVCSAASLDSFTINDISDDNIELVLKGTPDGAVEDDSISIQVLKQGLTSNDINTDSVSVSDIDKFVLITQVLADENGGYEVVANMAGEAPGFYWVRVNGEDVREIYYSSKADREAIINDIKENCASASEAEAISYLSENFKLADERSIWVNSFDISDPVVFEVSENGMFKVFLNMLSDLTIDNIKEKLTLSAYIAGLNENKIDISNYKDAFSLDDEYFAIYTENVADESAKADFMETYFEGKDYETVEEIQDAFCDAALTSWCNNFDSWEDAQDIIEKYGSQIGVDMGDYDDLSSTDKSLLYLYLSQIENYDDLDDFAKKANDRINDLADNGTGGGGTGGSGGGSGSGGSGSGGSRPSSNTPTGTQITPPIKPTEIEDSNTEEITFTDMTGYEWAEESVKALAEKGIVTGTGEGTFEPGRNVTREEMLVMILRSFEVEPGETKTDFTDAEADGWYNEYLAAAKEAGYVNGRPDGSFGVGEAVTREDAAVMAYNIAKAMGEEFDTSVSETFTDDEEVSEYAKEAVYALKNKGVINGKEEGVFAPKDVCTRAEAAKIIYTLIAE